MLPSVDNVFYIFIEVNLYCCLDEHNAINTAFQRYISSQLVLSIKKRIHMNPVLVKWKGHTKHCQNCPGNGRIITSKSNIAFHFRWKYMMEQALTDLAKADKEWSVILLRYFNPVGAHER